MNTGPTLSPTTALATGTAFLPARVNAGWTPVHFIPAKIGNSALYSDTGPAFPLAKARPSFGAGSL